MRGEFYQQLTNDTLFILNFAEVLTRHLVATYKFG